jgi:hypothetical protein
MFSGRAPGTVGRFEVHNHPLPTGRFRHASISNAAAVRGERLLGWAVHYATGILFAAVLVGLVGRDWLQRPTPGAALAFGVASVAAPFLVMQPAMGAGLAARRSPRPGRARMQSLATHAVFGAGLYVAAEVLRLISH